MYRHYCAKHLIFDLNRQLSNTTLSAAPITIPHQYPIPLLRLTLVDPLRLKINKMRQI
jgi:hypothetical protein